MHIVLTGATGLVGSSVLKTLPSDPSITRVSILSRRPVPAAAGHPKARVLELADFSSYPASLRSSLSDIKGIIWALGVSQSEVSSKEYEQITKDYILRFAETITTPAPAAEESTSPAAEQTTSPAAEQTTSPPPPSEKTPTKNKAAPRSVNLVYVSGEGATHTPSRLTPLFGRIKGETELALLAQGRRPDSFLRVYTPRPGAVVPDPETEQRRASALGRASRAVLFPLLGALRPSMVIPAHDLGKVLVELAKGDGEELTGEGVLGGRVLGNVAIRRMAGLG